MGIMDNPNELLFAIGEYLSIRDLYHFLSTCRRLSQLLIPRLHEMGVQYVHGRTALQWAAERGYTSLAELAILRGAEIDEPRGQYTGRGRTPLHSAAEHNYPAVIRILINNGASTAARDTGQHTPLHLAVNFGNEEATRVLLELGADMTCPANGGLTPVYLALKKKSVGCMKAFIDAGFDFNSNLGRPGGTTILHAAADIPYAGDEIMEYLLGQEGAKMAINAQDDGGNTPLHLACEKGVRLLSRHGADMGVKNKHGETAAHRAVHTNRVARLEALLEAGFDTKITAEINMVPGRTILHQAAFMSKTMLSYILGQEGGRAIINVQDSQGSTPLHLAVDCGLDFGRYYYWLIESRYPRQNWEENIRLLVEHGADPEIKDSYGNTPTHVAAYRGNVDCMKPLILAGFDFNLRGLRNRTILHGAIFGGLEMMEYLLKQKGVEMIINAPDSEGATPLNLASHHSVGKEEKVGLLLRYGAKPEEGESPGDSRTLGRAFRRNNYKEEAVRNSLERGLPRSCSVAL